MDLLLCLQESDNPKHCCDESCSNGCPCEILNSTLHCCAADNDFIRDYITHLSPSCVVLTLNSIGSVIADLVPETDWLSRHDR